LKYLGQIRKTWYIQVIGSRSRSQEQKKRVRVTHRDLPASEMQSC